MDLAGKLRVVAVAVIVTVGLVGCAGAPQGTSAGTSPDTGAGPGSHVSLYGTVDMGISAVRNSGN